MYGEAHRTFMWKRQTLSSQNAWRLITTTGSVVTCLTRLTLVLTFPLRKQDCLLAFSHLLPSWHSLWVWHETGRTLIFISLLSHTYSLGHQSPIATADPLFCAYVWQLSLEHIHVNTYMFFIILRIRNLFQFLLLYLWQYNSHHM